jgi:Tripartite tricarboxylate transporter family receptor
LPQIADDPDRAGAVDTRRAVRRAGLLSREKRAHRAAVRGIIKTLNSALREILANADVRKRLLDLGIEAKASAPEELSDRLKSDIDKWGKVIEKTGIQRQ